MALLAVEFLWRTIELVVSVNLLVSLIEVDANGPGPNMNREVAFTSQQMHFLNEKVCATLSPDLVLNRVRSNIECTVICKGTEGCSGVNWKKPSTCELYLARQRSFDTDNTVASCIYFGLGEKSDLDVV